MPRHEQPNPDTDPFRPPAIPTEVCCLHCGREYESYLIQWQEERDERGRVHGFWCCPTPGCDGKGFGFDIFPTDPEYCGEDGEPMWTLDGDEAETTFGEDEDSELLFEEWDAFEQEVSFDIDSELPDDTADGEAPPPLPFDQFGRLDMDEDDLSPPPRRNPFSDEDEEDIPF